MLSAGDCHNTDCCNGHDLIMTTEAIHAAGDGEVLATWLARTVEVALRVIDANRECPRPCGIADGEWQETTFGRVVGPLSGCCSRSSRYDRAALRG